MAINIPSVPPSGSTPRGVPVEPKGPRDVIVKAGQTVALHDGKKVLLRAICPADARYFTAWQAIVGTEAEVDAKIAQLNLK
jgi:hypothetical protein